MQGVIFPHSQHIESVGHGQVFQQVALVPTQHLLVKGQVDNLLQGQTSDIGQDSYNVLDIDVGIAGSHGGIDIWVPSAQH